MSFEEKMEADARSIYVGNVSKRSNSFSWDKKKVVVFSLIDDKTPLSLSSVLKLSLLHFLTVSLLVKI